MGGVLVNTAHDFSRFSLSRLPVREFFSCRHVRVKPGAGRLTFRPTFAYAFAVPDDPRQKNALLIAASLIAAVRTAREEEIKPMMPRLVCKVADSVRLARMVLKQIEQDSDGKADERYIRSTENVRR